VAGERGSTDTARDEKRTNTGVRLPASAKIEARVSFVSGS
jgi:hypothetical protein